MARPPGAPRTAVVTATTAVVALVGGWTWAATLVSGFDAGTESISALASLSTPHRWVMTAALVVTGLAHCGTAAALGAARLRGRLALALGGVATVAVALVPLPSRGESSTGHLVVASAAFLLLAVWPALAARPGTGVGVLRPRVAVPAAAVLTLAVGSLATPLWAGAFGVHERAVAGLTVLWPLVTAVGVWWAAGHRVGSRRVTHVLAGVLLAAACVGAGVAATTVAPVTAQTRTYQASVSLDGDPRRAGEITAETTFGNVELSFTGLAPGVRAVPQVKADITDVLSRPNTTLSALRPGPEELNTAIRDVGAKVLGRFALGALVLLVVVVGAWTLARRRPPPRWLVTASVGAWISAVLGTSAAVYTTYQPGRQGTFAATEVLGTLQQNQGLLGDVETRATQVAPYLRNLLALSTALQQKYAGDALEADPALRVLFVSDIHGANQYPLLRTIVEDQSVDLVVDGGDLVNFGTVEEAEAAGLFTGIASLGVPYVYVKGNHDATSATDTALLDRMAQVPNVLLVQDGAGDYREITANGITIAGFNDPRWFGDPGTGSRVAQLPARDRFTETFADRTPPDVVVSHEPWALQDVEGGVLLNGHMHVSDIEDNRVQVGTFTGGGPVSHYIAREGEDGEELVGQPSSFDILTFGTDCRLSSLTQYTLHDVIEGRPSYDDVSITNGRRIDSRPADPERTCTGDGPPTVETVPAP